MTANPSTERARSDRAVLKKISYLLVSVVCIGGILAAYGTAAGSEENRNKRMFALMNKANELQQQVVQQYREGLKEGDINRAMAVVDAAAADFYRARQQAGIAAVKQQNLEIIHRGGVGSIGDDVLIYGTIAVVTISKELIDAFTYQMRPTSKKIGVLDAGLYEQQFQVRLNEGHVWLQVGRPERARVSFEKVIAAFPQNLQAQGQAHYGIGRIHLAQEDYTTALTFLQKTLDLSDQAQAAFGLVDGYYPFYLYYIGMCKARAGEVEQARPQLERALEMWERMQWNGEERGECKELLEKIDRGEVGSSLYTDPAAGQLARKDKDCDCESP